MDTNGVARAVAAVTSVAAALDLPVRDVAIIQNSNKLSLRLLPCDVFARVAPMGQEVAALEVELAQQLAATDAPVAALEARVEPSVYQSDGFAVTLWTYYGRRSPDQLSPADYAYALERLHAGMRNVDVATPHVTNRLDEAQRLVASRERTPALDSAGRELLLDTLNSVRQKIDRGAAAEQLLHGEPHPGTSSTQRTGRASSTSKPAVVAQLNSTSLTCPAMSVSTTRISITISSTSVDGWCLRWSQRGDGMLTTSSRTDSVTAETSSPFSATVHPGQHSASSTPRDGLTPFKPARSSQRRAVSRSLGSPRSQLALGHRCGLAPSIE